MTRWDALFADLEAAAEAELEAERRSEVADRTRSELGRLRVVDRLRPLLRSDQVFRVGIPGHDAVGGRLLALGADWLLLGSPARGETLIPLAVVQWVQGLGRAAAEPGSEGVVAARLDLRIALRRLVRDRSSVVVGLIGGDAFGGRLGRVGADHLELEPERSGDDSEAHAGDGPGADGRLIPLSAIALVRRS